MNLVKLFPILSAGALPAGGAVQLLDFWLLPVLIPVAAMAAAIYYINSRPLRRQEGARFLLDLIDSAVQQGQSIEHHIISLANSRDASPGVRFHLLAAHLERGHGLIPALEKVPELLPPQVLAMLKVGASLGDFSRVLPACRLLLRDGTSQTRALINYQVAFGLILNPLMLVLLPMIFAVVLPVFKDVAIGMGLQIEPDSVYNRLPVMIPILFLVQMALLLGCYAFAVFVLGGTRFVSWLQAGMGPLRDWGDWLFLRVPWRRKRLQRDFSAMLALLLDAGVPKERALRLAAFSTANHIFMQRAEQAAERLRLGATLTEAVQLLDDTGEFRWRLINGAHGPRGFFYALQGWQASLDAKAFQLEQAAAHALSTSLVLINAVTVALVAAGVFQFIGHLGISPLRGK
jgi:hypothetical protein